MYLRLPAADASGAAGDPAQPEPVDLHPLRVLLVDDDELIQKATALLLVALGHTATVAATGEEALACLEEGLDPELVILDMNMPGLGGQGTLPRLRGRRPELPVILATGRADEKALALVAAYPRVTLLPKPFTAEDLTRALADYG